MQLVTGTDWYSEYLLSISYSYLKKKCKKNVHTCNIDSSIHTII